LRQKFLLVYLLVCLISATVFAYKLQVDPQDSNEWEVLNQLFCFWALMSVPAIFAFWKEYKTGLFVVFFPVFAFSLYMCLALTVFPDAHGSTWAAGEGARLRWQQMFAYLFATLVACSGIFMIRRFTSRTQSQILGCGDDHRDTA
jgi:hypothetical protein